MPNGSLKLFAAFSALHLEVDTTNFDAVLACQLIGKAVLV
jgi:hypothetical protein